MTGIFIEGNRLTGADCLLLFPGAAGAVVHGGAELHHPAQPRPHRAPVARRFVTEWVALAAKKSVCEERAPAFTAASAV